MSGDYTLEVKREELIKALQEKKKEVEESWKDKLTEAEQAVELASDPNKAWAEWYGTMAKLVKDGKLVYDPTKPRGERWVPKVLGGERPSPPDVLNLEEKQREFTNYTNARNRAVEPFDAAIKLLEMAVGDTVTMPVSEYERLLNTRVR